MRAEVRFGERLTRRRELWRSALTSGPGILWVSIFLLVPLVAVAAIAFLTRGPYGEVARPITLQNFHRLLGFGVFGFDALYPVIIPLLMKLLT